MLESIGQAVLTALFSSAATLALGKLVLDRWGVQMAHRWLEEAAAEMERRVRDGAHAAGAELLPEVRARVREGVEDAVVALASGSSVSRSLQEIQRGGARFLGEKLEALLRRKTE